MQHFPIILPVSAHQHHQLVRQLANRREIRDRGFFAKVEDYEESPVKPIQLSEVGENINVGVDEAEPATLEWELWLTQVVQKTILGQKRAFLFLLGLEGKSAKRTDDRTSYVLLEWTLGM